MNLRRFLVANIIQIQLNRYRERFVLLSVIKIKVPFRIEKCSLYDRFFQMCSRVYVNKKSKMVIYILQLIYYEVTLDKRLMAAASVIAVILFLTVNIGSSVLNSNTQLAFDTKKHNSGTADINGMRSSSSLSKSINYTYEVKSPTSVLNSLNIIAAHRGVT